MEIIDFHAHPYYDFHDPVKTMDEFFDDAKACGITRICGSVIYKGMYKDKDMNKYPVEYYEKKVPELNDMAFALAKERGESFYPGIHVHPDFLDMSMRELDRAKEKGYLLVGEQVWYMMRYDRFASDNFIEICRRAGELGMAVNLHPTTAKDMFALSEAVRDTTLVWAHLSGYEIFEEELEMLKKYENVWFDISAHGLDFPDGIRRTIDTVGYDRILFGTDYPGYDPKPYIEAVMRQCNERECEAIFSGNAKRILGLR